MKNLKTIFGTVLMTLTLLTSCETKDDGDNDFDNAIDIATAQEFKNIKDTALANLTQNFTFNADDGNISLTSANGVQININGNCLTLNGNIVTGQVQLEYVELFEKGNMLTTNKPTMGTLPNGDKTLLISGGEFFIEATQNGSALDTTCGLQLIIPASLTGGADPLMSLWEGEIDAEDNLTWDEVEDATGQGGVFVEGSEYYGLLQGFGWSNVDRFYSDPRPKTLIQVQAPIGYNFTNSAVYLSYDGEDSGLAALDTYDGTLNLFSEHYGQIPIGLECHVIFVTEDKGVWRYAIKPVTIEANDIITFTMDDTTTGTEATLTALINGLP
ncbi:hypothetical protein [Olleya sp. Hel_I_94]|uniref:hypothetical protein n=1 Tax=Olleya sp. Hel_I_94 TaxID=1250001 RepID=UPI00119E04A6|nr:hypothetical protein [Olleya sp. Hel_I_94]TVZ48457.1 hypothetical protein JM82_3100 [Olleya sp. Hel_I_94]|tara:strand:+ start:108239 stop:109222 length:984 start_codon:yes stop_codon:yes gene_type:complete